MTLLDVAIWTRERKSSSWARRPTH